MCVEILSDEQIFPGEDHLIIGKQGSNDTLPHALNAIDEGDCPNIIPFDKEKTSYTLSEILSTEFPPLDWFVERIITSGLSLLWGAPKSGKSVLALDIALAASNGGKVIASLKAKKSQVLLISLEDGARRLRNRFQSLSAEANEDLIIKTDWWRGDKGVHQLSEYLDKHPDIKIVIIDTLFLFLKIADAQSYTQTTSAIEKLKKIADDRDIAIITIHHSKKLGKDDFSITESALGSTGIVAGPDHLLFLKRTPGENCDAILYFKSKDADGAELALEFESKRCCWKYIGDYADIIASQERQDILNLFRAEGKELTTGEIAQKLGKTKQ